MPYLRDLIALALLNTTLIGCSRGVPSAQTPIFIIVTATSDAPTDAQVATSPVEQPTISAPTNAEVGHVTRVIDGDTIEVSIQGSPYRVRYIGMNTPETYQVCGDIATEANAALVADRDVTLVKDISETDRYGRLLRYVYVGDLFVNAELVRQGFAEVATYPPDVAHVDEFKQLASQAREASLGCWATEVWGGSPAELPGTAPPTIAVVAGAIEPCDCTGRDLDCGSFDTQDEAQACFNYCMQQGYGDTFRLDGNSDMIACQSLP